MDIEVEEIKKEFEEQIKKQFSNSQYRNFLDKIIYLIENDNFDFIKGTNLKNRICGKIIEDIVAVLYNLKQTNQYSNDFIIDGIEYEFKTAFNGNFVVKFYFKNDIEDKNNVVFYQKKKYLVADIKVENNICDFLSIQLYTFKKEEIENKIIENVENNYYSEFENEMVYDEFKNYFKKYKTTIHI